MADQQQDKSTLTPTAPSASVPAYSTRRVPVSHFGLASGAHSRSRRRRGASKRAKRGSIALVIVCVLIAALGIAGCSLLWVNTQDARASSARTSSAVAASVSEAITTKAPLHLSSVARDSLEAFFGASGTFTAASTASLHGQNIARQGLPILMYHAFYDPSKGEKQTTLNYYDIRDFEKEMKYLHDNGYYYPSWSEVADFVAGKKSLPTKSIVVTSDDGDPSFFSEALPVLDKYQVKASAFIITARTPRDFLEEHSSQYVTYQSHSHAMHGPGTTGSARLMDMTYEEIEEDLRETRNVLGDPDAFCYPFGISNDLIVKALPEQGFRAAVTTKYGRVRPGDDPFLLPRVRINGDDSYETFLSKIK